MPNSYTHLDDYANSLVHASPGERVQSILKLRFIEYPTVRRIREWIDRRIQSPRCVRPPCLLIAADEGAGKTSILLHLQRCHPDRVSSQGGKTVRPIVRCDIEPHPEVRTLEQTLLTQLGAPLLDRRSNSLRSGLIHRYLHELDTQVVFFDEFQHILHLTSRSQAVALDWIKWISTLARVHVICAGSQGVERLVQNDPQLSGRFPVTRLPRWTAGQALGTFLQAYERSLPLQRPSRLWELPMQRALLEQTREMQAAGVTGAIVRIIQEAAVAAVVNGREHITRELLSAWRESTRLPGSHEGKGDSLAVSVFNSTEPNDSQMGLAFEE